MDGADHFSDALSDGGTSIDGPHRAALDFEYGDERRARIVERSVRVEIGEIDDERSRAAVEREGAVVTVTVCASDLVALRAGLNTWTRLLSVAEELSSPG